MLSFKNCILSAVFCLAGCCFSMAQTVDRLVTEKYEPSVVAKLFGIVKYVDVEPELQLQLAESIRKHDSVIASWIIAGRSKASIDTLQQVSEFRLYGMLSKKQLQTYKFNSHVQVSNAIAEGEAEYLLKEYKPDSLTFQDIKRSLTNKYNYILQGFSDNYLFNHELAGDYLKKMEEIYDHYKYYPVFYARKFIGDYLTKINKVKNIPGKMQAEIEHEFYSQVWQNKYTDWSMAAQNATRKHFPDTAIFASLLQKEIEQQAFEATAKDRYYLVFREHVSEEAFKKLENLISEKNHKNSVLQYTYSAFHPQRFANMTKANTEYYDSVIKATLIYDGSSQPNTQFAIALKYKTQLQLRSSLCDTLVKHAMYLEKQRDSIFFRDPFATIDFGEYETRHLSRLLTEDQYNTLLFHKNRTYAEANALTDWKEMEERGLDKGFIRDQAVSEMTQFYIIKNAAWCRYANNKIKLWANLAALDQIKPKALKVLDPVRWSGSTETVTNNLQLQW